MKKLISKFVLTLVLIGFSIPLNAQTKYDFAVVTYYPWGRDLMISLNGDKYSETKFDKDEIEGIGDVNIALREVQKMNENGWEVFETNTTVADDHRLVYTFYLRRKKYN